MNAGFCVQKPRLPLITICRQAAKDSTVQSSSNSACPSIHISAPGPLVRMTCAEYGVEGICRCRVGAKANWRENNQSCQK